MKWVICLFIIMGLHASGAAQNKDLDLDIAAPDGVKLVKSSTNPASTMRDVNKGWHGVTMFDEDPSLVTTMADWVAKVLR